MIWLMILMMFRSKVIRVTFLLVKMSKSNLELLGLLFIVCLFDRILGNNVTRVINSIYIFNVKKNSSKNIKIYI